MKKKSEEVSNNKIEAKNTAKMDKRAEDGLKESDELYRLLADQSIVGMHIIQDGCIKYTNRATALITGYSIEEMMNWGTDGYSILLHPDESSFVMEQVRKKQTGDPT